MKHNVGGIDRNGRILLGVVLLIVGIAAHIAIVWKAVVLILAAIALVTAFARFCPINALLKINTSKTDDNQEVKHV